MRPDACDKRCPGLYDDEDDDAREDENKVIKGSRSFAGIFSKLWSNEISRVRFFGVAILDKLVS